jgi:hypothetical protein
MSSSLNPASEQHVSTNLHLASVLCQLFVDMEQRSALGPRKG